MKNILAIYVFIALSLTGCGGGGGGSIGQVAGEFEAESGDDADLFGLAVSISADGSTLAIGAPLEGSNATEVNGNEANNDAPLAEA